MTFVLWWMVNIWIPAQMCVSTGGIYVPAEPEAVVICEALRSVHGV